MVEFGAVLVTVAFVALYALGMIEGRNLPSWKVTTLWFYAGSAALLVGSGLLLVNG